jgi:uncharacterized membrane protein HdeD (DUF308 family)
MKKSTWVVFFINGMIALLFGLLLLFVSEVMILKLVRIFGVVLFLAGLVMFYFSYRNMKTGKSYMIVMVEAIFAVLIGLILTIAPGKSLNLFLTLIGIWAVIMGLIQIIMTIRLRKKVSQHYLFSANGVITLVFGLLLIYSPMATLGSLITIIGILSVLAGIVMIYLGFKVKGIKE